MNIINNLILMLRVYIIPLVVVLRCIYCFVKIMTDYDEKSIWKKNKKLYFLFYYGRGNFCYRKFNWNLL